jgi:hypothetical protein
MIMIEYNVAHNFLEIIRNIIYKEVNELQKPVLFQIFNNSNVLIFNCTCDIKGTFTKTPLNYDWTGNRIIYTEP